MDTAVGLRIRDRKISILTRFAIYCLLLLLIQASFQYLLVSDNLYFNALQTQLSYEQIENILAQGKKWQWLGYLALPVVLLLKFSLVTCCLCLGYFFSSNKFVFKSFFGLSIVAELLFILPALLKILWFLFVQTDYSLNDLNQFYPLSLLNLFNQETLPRYWIYPLATLNMFEVVYWFLLAYGVAGETGLSYNKSFGLVMSSYGVGLLLWIVLVMFLTITYS